ncbi:tRNA (adenosine(37)-N6)-threonylcarbamoyltransferase complex ATPase subunit type 1 TsaE [Lactococcus hircilactis]|nr:tRNA (adenosine(37)-N6)-threonylcarbamoyltransferase complex ATPase subunit type 1 TsaE [Lactococcus hircilactis]
MKFNEAQMLKYAEHLARACQAGDIIVLTGELGAGKTTFVKGFALGLDIHQMIKSPTYTIVREYEGRLPLYHMDVYRVGDDPDSFDMDDYLFGQGVSVIEWGELLGKDLPQDYLEIIFDKYVDGFDADGKRELRVIPHGKRYQKWVLMQDNKA